MQCHCLHCNGRPYNAFAGTTIFHTEVFTLHTSPRCNARACTKMFCTVVYSKISCKPVLLHQSPKLSRFSTRKRTKAAQYAMAFTRNIWQSIFWNTKPPQICSTPEDCTTRENMHQSILVLTFISCDHGYCPSLLCPIGLWECQVIHFPLGT